MTQSQNTISTSFVPTRREALKDVAYGSVVMALPPVAAIVSFDLTRQGAAMTETPDPHLAWWAELQRLDSAVDWSGNFLPDEDAMADRVTELENLIAETAPTTQEGAAIIALAGINEALSLGWQLVGAAAG